MRFFAYVYIQQTLAQRNNLTNRWVSIKLRKKFPKFLLCSNTFTMFHVRLKMHPLPHFVVMGKLTLSSVHLGRNEMRRMMPYSVLWWKDSRLGNVAPVSKFCFRVFSFVSLHVLYFVCRWWYGSSRDMSVRYVYRIFEICSGTHNKWLWSHLSSRSLSSPGWRENVSQSRV